MSGNVGTNVTGSYGILHVDANGSYTYTLTSPYNTSPAANDGPNTEPARDVFTFTVTDGLGNTSTSTVSISIVDDVPTAHVDVNAAASGQTVTGNVETNDTAGADGIASIAWAGAVGNTAGRAGAWRADVRRHWRLQLQGQPEHVGDRHLPLHHHRW